METLMLEIKTQGLHQYHRLDKAETRVGRALSPALRSFSKFAGI